MNALIRMLFNTANRTYHPILYFEKLLPGGPEAEINQKLLRFKSKGHHTIGFVDLNQAKTSASELAEQVKAMGYTAWLNLEPVLEWDGVDIPADVCTIPREQLQPA